MERAQSAALEGRYRIGAPLERWGIGRCSEAIDEVRGGRVILKHFTELVRLPGMREEVDRALDTVERLGHACVTPIVGRGWLDHSPYLLVEPGAARPLSTELLAWRTARRVPPLNEVCQIASDIAGALAWVHGLRTPLAHGCLSAESVLVRHTTDRVGEACLMDVGLRVIAHAQAATFQAGLLIDARAPELRDMPRASSIADDVFAFGVLLWTLVTPWETSEGQGLRTALVRGERHDAMTWLRGLRSDVPEELWQLVLRCIEIDPSRRPRDGEALLSALNRSEFWDNTATLPPWPSGERSGLTRGLRVGASRWRASTPDGSFSLRSLAREADASAGDATVRESVSRDAESPSAATRESKMPDEPTLLDRASRPSPPTTEVLPPPRAPLVLSAAPPPQAAQGATHEEPTQILQPGRRPALWIVIIALAVLLALLFVLWLQRVAPGHVVGRANLMPTGR